MARTRRKAAVLCQSRFERIEFPFVAQPVDGKARLGAVVGRKTSSVLAFGDVRAEDKAELAKLVSAIKANYTDKYAEASRHWGGGLRGTKSYAKLQNRAKVLGQDPSKVSKYV